MFTRQSGYSGRGSYQSGPVRICLLIVCLLLLAQPASSMAASPPGPTPVSSASLPDTSYPSLAEPGQLESLPSMWFSAGKASPLPNLHEFIAQVANHQAGMVRGVYVPGMFALPVVQQPRDNYSFVSPVKDMITQFRSATYFDVIGLLAHNYLSGSLFHQLFIGQPVIIVMGDGSIRRYVISDSSAFQRVQQAAKSDEFVDLISGESYSTRQVFNRFYRGKHHLTFQTCLEKGGDLDWGLLFVVAQPVMDYSGQPARAHLAPR